jgi:hypothetical protein
MAARNQADLWREIVTEAGDEATVHAAEVTGAAAERELAAGGFDVAKERAKAVAQLHALERTETQVIGAAEAPVEEQAWVARVETAPVRSAPARWMWLLAATLALATAGGVLYGLGHRPKPVEVPPEAPTTPVPTMTAPATPPGPAPVSGATVGDKPRF